MLLHEGIDYSRVLIVEPNEQAAQTAPLKKRGACIEVIAITKGNYRTFLKKHAQQGDIIIDLSVNVDTPDLIDWCQEHGVMFINTSVEWWDPNEESHIENLADRTLSARHAALEKRAQKWNKNGPTAVVEHGANPGLASHWTKKTLVDITHQLLTTIDDKKRIKLLETALDTHNFAHMAFHTGTKVIHISERDTQNTRVPKKVNEFVNTWSVDGLYEEGTAPAELSWGTHEKTLPSGGCYLSGEKTQICLDALGINTLMYSWIPSGPIIGTLIRHGEATSIGELLTMRENEKLLYSPTVQYVYLPSDSALASLHELTMLSYKLQPLVRILYDDIQSGHDELGVLLLGHDFNGWWQGSRLSIGQTRALVGPGNNATTLQVAASVFAAVTWMIKNPNKGFCFPEALPYEDILAVANPYLGDCISTKTDWNPIKSHAHPLNHHNQPTSSDPENMWQFDNFIFNIRRN